LKKIIYIAGLGHSGSTVLDMALGAHPEIVGLGEIYAVLNHKDHLNLFEKSTCSCGKKGNDCDFWKEAKDIATSNELNEEKYLKLIDLFDRLYNNNLILVDSSKNSYPYLKMLNAKFDLRILYLSRDFRSWSYSRSSRTRKPLVYLILRWFLENKKLLYVLKKYKLNYFKVGYEELAHFPELILKKVSTYTGIEFHDSMLSPANTKSHIISGNIARVDNSKKTKFYYDMKWMVSGRLNFVSGFFSCFSKFNNKLIYTNIIKGEKKAFGKKSADFHIFGNKRKEDLINEHN